MKTFIRALFSVILLICVSAYLYGQVEVKGSGNTSATKTLSTKNSDNTITTVILDNGDMGIGTTTPTQKLEVNGTIYSSSGGFMFPDGTTLATAGGTPYFRVYTVSPSGGDYTSITAALNACGVTAPTKRFLIRVMPGIYTENVQCKQYVHLKGAGKYTTVVIGNFTATDSCVIEDFRVEGHIYCLACSPTILHNVITDTTGGMAGIHVQTLATGDTAMPWIKENEILDCTQHGIFCDGVASDAWIIGNKIMRNGQAGIRIENCCPTISNNEIMHNTWWGIFMLGMMGTPAEPTISDNVIGYTGYQTGGIGIYITMFAEPRILSNDIYLNECGIWINQDTQPSIVGNDINYNYEAGIRIFSGGATKPPVITGNHIHSNANMMGAQPAGIWIQLGMMGISPIISHNVIVYNSVPVGAGMPDIDYTTCLFPGGLMPTLSCNIYDVILRSGGGPGPGPAFGQYNSTSIGLMINP